MRYKITSHIDKESGHFKGYSLSYKPFPFIPYWKRIYKDGRHGLYDDLKTIEHDVCFLLRLDGVILDASKVE